MSPENGHGPIQEATAGLVSWLAGATGAAVRTAPPSDTNDDVDQPVLSVLVLALAREQELRSADRREPLRFRVRHLVTGPVASDVTASLLDRVLTAAVEAGEPMVVLDPPPPEARRGCAGSPRRGSAWPDAGQGRASRRGWRADPALQPGWSSAGR